MHAVISLLLQSMKFWQYLLLTYSVLPHSVIMTSYCCERYRVSGNDFVPAGQCSGTPRRVRATVELLRQETPNFLTSNLRPPNSPDLSPLDCQISAVMQHCVYRRQIHSVDELKRRLIDVWCSLEQSIFDETVDQWRGRHRACVHAIPGHFEYSLWTDNVDLVDIGYTQCDLFDCYIFNYEIMPATLANTFLFILQGSVLADLRCSGRFYATLS